jgi:YVTN family beta-propeller protein
VLAAEPLYLALLSASGAVAYLSPSGRIVSKVPVGQNPVKMVFSPDKRYLYTADGGNAVSIVDVSARRKIGDIPLGRYRQCRGIAVDPKTGNIAVVTGTPEQLLLIDAARRSVVKQFATGGLGSASVTFGPGGTWVYVSNEQSGTVSAIHTVSGETKVIRTGDRPEDSILSSDGKELYVLNRESNNIAILDTTSQQMLANIIVGQGPERGALLGDGKTLVHSLRNERKVAFADTRLRRRTDYVIVPGEPVSCTLSNDKQHAIVATATGAVYIISISTKKISGEIKTEDGSVPAVVFEMPAS